LKRRQPFCDWVIESQPAPLDKRHRCSGDDGLAEGCEPEDLVLTHGALAFAVSVPGSAMISDRTVFNDNDDGANNAPFGESPIDFPIHTRREVDIIRQRAGPSRKR